MAVIHISRTEAENDFDGLIARAGQGDEVIIGDMPPIVLKHAVRKPGRYLSEIIASAERRASTVTLDEDLAGISKGSSIAIVSRSQRGPHTFASLVLRFPIVRARRDDPYG